MNRVINSIEKRFNTMPILTIWMMRMWPLANTIALGGVAMGNIKAHDAASVPPITNSNGFSPRLIATPASTGTKIVVSARLLMHSVRKSAANMLSSTMPNMPK